MQEFLPISRRDMAARGWSQCDFVYIIGDAYVDHPSFGHAIISRVLEHAGYKVGDSSPSRIGGTRIPSLPWGSRGLAFWLPAAIWTPWSTTIPSPITIEKPTPSPPAVSAGSGPDYATIVYCNLIRQRYRHTPILIGGIEASLRRLGHYDYWSDKVKRSILLDSQADLLLYGMGERSIVAVADALNDGLSPSEITYIEGTCYKTKDITDGRQYLQLPEFAEISANKKAYARSFALQYANTDPFSGKRLAERYPGGVYVVQNPPQKPLSQQEMDAVYALPYCRNYHPSYEKLGGVPALQEVKFSLVSNRGCFGGCSFCALTFHQGRIVQTRSHESILAEARHMTEDPAFKGYIHDVGGPTANFRQPACQKQLTHGACPHKQCLFPAPCQKSAGRSQ